MKPVFKDYSIVLTIWIDAALDKPKPDTILIDDLWKIQDIIEGISYHKKHKQRLLKRMKNMSKNPETNGILKYLEAHYGKA